LHLEKLQKYVDAPGDERGEAIASMKISGKGAFMALVLNSPSSIRSN
jgi:hypothetical protein